MSTHQAAEQMLGYLYQMRYALLLLLDCDNPDCQVGIEKFDDIALSDDGSPTQLVQLKYHNKRNGDLSDASTDLWRTLNVWIDTVSASPDILDHTNFLIITTSAANAGSAASLLKDDNNRNTTEAYWKLSAVCSASKNVAHKSYYSAFTDTDKDVVERLLEKVYVIDRASNMVDVGKKILKHIRYSCRPKYQNKVLEKLEGWWFEKVIGALHSDSPFFVDQNQVRDFIVATSREYEDDDLPIDVLDIDDLSESELSHGEKVFIEQLKLICIGNHYMQVALRDYYRAFEQRASWVRNGLLYDDDLRKYEYSLIDEWEHIFARMEDALLMSGNSTEDEKIKEGQNLFFEIEKKDIRIRERCRQPFIARGSYHILSNQLRVGWHVDFLKRLNYLLNPKESA